MNSQRKAEIKESVLSFVKHCKKSGVNLGLPVPVKAMAKAIPGCRVIPYSVHCKRYQLTRKQMIEYTQTDDACADYDINTGRALIFYNDLDLNKTKSNRYRWNIAHEIGHLWLKHHIKYEECRLFRSTMSDELYNQLEDEADTFAAYLLVPHGAVAVLSRGQLINQEWLRQKCCISNPAAYQRIACYQQWYNTSGLRKTHKFADSYDLQMARLFSHYLTCKTCKNKVVSRYSWVYCPICGESRFFYDKGERAVIYPGVKVNEFNKPYVCPICQNEETFVKGSYCQVCGERLTNHCVVPTEDDNIDEFDEFAATVSCCEESKDLPANARFCPYCGRETFFNLYDLLPKWTDVIEEERRMTQSNDAEILAENDLPF